MQEAVYLDPTGRAYTVRDGVSVWLDAPASVHEAQPEYAGFGIRLGARLIDLVITFVLAFVSGMVVSTAAVLLGAQSAVNSSGTATAGGYFFSFVASTAFYVIAESVHGSTPGKMALGITVRSADGGQCGVVQALKRELAFFIDSLFFGLPAFSSMKKGPRRQRIGDRWASTVVVKRNSLSSVQLRSGQRFAAATLAACASYAFIVGLGLLA